jgi:hypothetical protein
MLPLAQKLLTAAGFEYDAIDQIWVVPVPLPPLVTVECHQGDEIVDAILEVHAVLETHFCTYSSFSINGRYVSIVGLTKAQVVAAA